VITINDDVVLTRNEEGFFGITIAEEYIILDTAIGYEIVDANIQGGSGGLLQTLNLYNRLTEDDITKGYHIAGTGNNYCWWICWTDWWGCAKSHCCRS
jgi:PDZ domain-containing secreted protein